MERTISILLPAFALALGSPGQGAWEESIAKAINKGSSEEIRSGLKERNAENPLEIDFVQAVAAWTASGSHRDVRDVLARNFQGPLAAAFGSGSPETYSSLLEEIRP